MDKICIEKLSKLPDDTDASKIFNINIGILGHVDSGKTSLSKRLSTIASTACFDKNPQSQERGITLDLGFSAFFIKTPTHIKEKYETNKRLVNSDYIQLTLVDCPGHASLIKTVIAGASIIDSIVLVIDITKGIQTQTTECLILAEILCDSLIVALNKIDSIPIETREKDLQLKISKLRNAFAASKFGKEVNIVPVSAYPKNPEEEDWEKYLNNLIMTIIDKLDFDKRNTENKKLLFSIDHCFSIKNKGTIVTGTVLQGTVNQNEEIYFPEICEKKIVKEIQMFKKPIQKAFQGDRIGMLIKNLDATKIERSIASKEGYVNNCEGGLFLLNKVKYFKLGINSGSKFYLIAGNQGVSVKCIFFSHETMSCADIMNMSKTKKITDYEYKFVESLENDCPTFAYLEFDNKLLLPPESMVVGSKIDIDISDKVNRFAFYGKMVEDLKALPNLKIFKNKQKEGKIQRIVEDNLAVIIGLFKKDSNYNQYIGRSVYIKNSNVTGVIKSSFGQSGKIKVEFNANIRELKVKQDEKEVESSEFVIVLEYKKYLKLAC